MKQLISVLRFALRQMAKSPASYLLCIAVLAGAMSMVTSMFALTRVVLYSRVPYEGSDRVARLQNLNERRETGSGWGFKSWRAISRQRDAFEDSLAFFRFSSTLLVGDRTRPLQSCFVSTNLSEFTGFSPILGRAFEEGDARPGAAPVILLGERFWRESCGERSDIVGSCLLVNGVSRTVVGVLPEAFDGPVPLTEIQAWMPLDPDGLLAETGWGDYVGVLVKVRSGLTREEARKGTDAFVASLARQYPDENPDTVGGTLRFVNGEYFDGATRAVFRTLFLAAILILLMACGIAAGQMTARYSTRTLELAVRSALGASRWQIVLQMIVEFTLVSTVAAILGFLLSRAISVCYLADYFQEFKLPAFMMDRRSWVYGGFTVGVLVVVTFLSTLVPALRATRTNLSAVLHDSTRTGSSLRVTRLSHLVVIWQVATAGAVLSGGLMIGNVIRTYSRMNSRYDASRYVCATISFSERDHPGNAAKLERVNRIMNEFERHPQLCNYGMTNELFDSYGWRTSVWTDGAASRDRASAQNAVIRVVSPGYFEAMNVPILLGRGFEKEDNTIPRRVAVVTDTFARKWWGTTDVLGRTFRFEENGGDLSIVGVTTDVFGSDGTRLRPPGFFVPYSVAPWHDIILFSSSRGDIARTGEILEKIVSDVDPRICVSNVMPLDEYRRLFGSGLYMYFLFSILVVFAAGALVMAATGLFGVISFTVNMRKRDTGIRMALGASAAHILLLNTRAALWDAAIGTMLAVMGSMVLRVIMLRGFDEFLPDTESWTVYAASYAILLCVVLAAILLPVWRLLHAEPGEVLRDE